MRSAFYLLFPLLLTACGEPSIESLVENAEKRQEILKDCAELGIAAKDEERCVNAAKAEAIAVKSAIQDIDTQLFD